jgi:hypothetical protein
MDLLLSLISLVLMARGHPAQDFAVAMLSLSYDRDTLASEYSDEGVSIPTLKFVADDRPMGVFVPFL